MSADAEQYVAQLNAHVVQLYQQGAYEEAITLGAQALELARAQLGEDHVEFGASLNSPAVELTRRVLGDTQRAVRAGSGASSSP